MDHMGEKKVASSIPRHGHPCRPFPRCQEVGRSEWVKTENVSSQKLNRSSEKDKARKRRTQDGSRESSAQQEKGSAGLSLVTTPAHTKTEQSNQICRKFAILETLKCGSVANSRSRSSTSVCLSLGIC